MAFGFDNLTDFINSLSSLSDKINYSENSVSERNDELCKELHRIGDIILTGIIYFAGYSYHLDRDPNRDDKMYGTVSVQEAILFVNDNFGGNL